METININQNKEFYKNIIDDTNENLFDNVFDVAIIGGGFAGLSAALLLGRYLRSTIIFDVKETRKSLIHGYLGFEKTPREELIKKSWQDVLQYNSIKRVENKVEKIEKDIDSNLFIISTVPPEYENYEKDKNNVLKREARARYLIISTGVKYSKPSIKNFEDYNGNGIWHCPHCDGFETANKRLVIVASDNTNNKALDYAKLFLGWTKDITLFIDSSQSQEGHRQRICSLNEQQRNEARVLGIKVVENDSISEVVGDQGTNIIKGVITQGNKFFKSDVLFYNFEKIIQNNLAIQLGCELDEGYLKVDEKQQTSVPNVYAAGDIDTDRHYAILAAASGALAAISIYENLLKEAIKIKKVEDNNVK